MFRYGRTARTTRGVRAVQAQRGGDPGEISAAYANLREAVEAARKASSAALRVRPRPLAELGLLAPTAADHARAPADDRRIERRRRLRRPFPENQRIPW